MGLKFLQEGGFVKIPGGLSSMHIRTLGDGIQDTAMTGKVRK